MSCCLITEELFKIEAAEEYFSFYIQIGSEAPPRSLGLGRIRNRDVQIYQGGDQSTQRDAILNTAVPGFILSKLDQLQQQSQQ